MENEKEIKWAIFHICTSIRRVSGTKFSRKEAMVQILKEIQLYGHDLSLKISNHKDHCMEQSRFSNWITRFHVSHRFKTMMNMNGIRRGKIY